MDQEPNQYHGLRFARPQRLTLSKRWVIPASFLLFTLAWWLIPHATLYWLLSLLFTILLWMASYGWRQALAALHDLLHRLEQS